MNLDVFALVQLGEVSSSGPLGWEEAVKTVETLVGNPVEMLH